MPRVPEYTHNPLLVTSKNAHGIPSPVPPHPYQGFSSGSTCKPSLNLFRPANRSTTAISSRIASSSSPSFRTAEVWTDIQ